MNCPVKTELQDDDWEFIVFEFNMNYSVDSMRSAYQEAIKKEKSHVDDDLLISLGYTDKDLLERRE